MAKIVRFNSSLSSPEWDVCQTYLKEGSHYYVEGERFLADAGGRVTYSLSPTKKSNGNFGIEFNSRWFTVVEDTFKNGNIGVSVQQPKVGEPLDYKLVEPIEHCMSLNRKFGFTDERFDEYWISEVKYMGDHIFYVSTDIDVYYLLVRDVKSTPDKVRVKLAVANDGIPPRPGEQSKYLSQIVWAPHGCMILNSMNVVISNWIRISEHLYKVMSRDTVYYVLAWYV